MNTVMLNIVSLDDEVIIKKGSGGGGVTINNQSKSVDITENGNTEIRYDAGYTGLEKVSVNVNVVSDNDIAETDAGICAALYAAGLCANETYITKAEAAVITESQLQPGSSASTSIFYNKREEIKSFNGFQYFTGLKSIPKYLFWVTNMLTSIKLPNTISVIGERAFYGSSLTSIEIPEGVTVIEDSAFYSSDLITVELPASLESIGGWGFYMSTKISSITIKAQKAPELGSSAFGNGPGNYTGCNSRVDNILYVPANATGYDTGKWLSPLQNPDECGFTIKYQGEINNQDKSIDIVENGTTEIVADSGYTGLGKVTINTNIASSGGGGSDIPVIGDGKTYLYIKIAEKGRMNVPLYFSQTVANGVTIDWGDGSAPQTLSGTGNKNTTHTYADVGEYTISLNPADGCTLGLGRSSSSYCVMGSTGNNGKVYCNMLQAVEIGKNVISIGDSAFNSCYSLASIVIPEGVTSIGQEAFYNCYSLLSVKIPNGVTSIGFAAFTACHSLASAVIPSSVTSIGSNTFNSCYSLSSIVIPENVTSIGDSTFASCYSLSSVVISNGVARFVGSAFYNCYSISSVVIPVSVTSIGNYSFSNCYGMTFYDFSQHTSIPTLGGTMVFSDNPSDCKIVVPDTLYDSWIAATNWSSYASKIVKASEFNG